MPLSDEVMNRLQPVDKGRTKFWDPQGDMLYNADGSVIQPKSVEGSAPSAPIVEQKNEISAQDSALGKFSQQLRDLTEPLSQVPSPIDVAQKLDPLSPKLPLKDRMFNAAMMVGPGGAVAGAGKVAPWLLERGMGPLVARTALGGAAGGVAGAPFGKPVEGAISGTAGSMLGDLGDYFLRYGMFFGKGGAPGVVKRFVNQLGELTGLKAPLKDGSSALKEIGPIKDQFYEKVYEPVKAQVKGLWPDQDFQSSTVEKLLSEGRTEVLPPRLQEVYRSRSLVEDKVQKATLKYGEREAVMENELQNTQGQLSQLNPGDPQYKMKAQDLQKRQGQIIGAIDKLRERADIAENFLRDTFKNELEPVQVSFDEMSEISSNLRNRGWGKEPRTGAMSPEERSSAHEINQEMIREVGQRDPQFDPATGASPLAEQFSKARSHAHAWELTQRMLEESNYVGGDLGKQTALSRLQDKYKGYVEDMGEALGPDFNDTMIKSLFGGRLNPDQFNREFGIPHVTAHGGSGFGAHFAAYLKPGSLATPPLKGGIGTLLKTGIPAEQLGELVSGEQRSE